jgi:hypothetical protein
MRHEAGGGVIRLSFNGRAVQKTASNCDSWWSYGNLRAIVTIILLQRSLTEELSGLLRKTLGQVSVLAMSSILYPLTIRCC